MVTRVTAVAVLTCVVLLCPLHHPRFGCRGAGRRRRQTQSGERGEHGRLTSAAIWPDGRGLPGCSWPSWASPPSRAGSPNSFRSASTRSPARSPKPSGRTKRPGNLSVSAAQDEVRGLIEEGRRGAEKVGQQLVDKARGGGRRRAAAGMQAVEWPMAALKELADRQRDPGTDWPARSSVLKAADHSRLIEQAVTEFTRSRPVKVNGKPRNGIHSVCD